MIWVFKVACNLSASNELPWFKASTLVASEILYWVIASFLAAFCELIVLDKLVINCWVWLSLEALNWAAAFAAAWSDNIACCLFCVFNTSVCWALVKLVISICKNDLAFSTACCCAKDKLAISIVANCTAFCIVACWLLFKFVNSNVLNKLEFDIAVCCWLFKFKTSIPAIVCAFAKAVPWALFKLAKDICWVNCPWVKPACCKLAKFANLTCCCWLAEATIACCSFIVLSLINSCANWPFIMLAFISFSALTNCDWKLCWAVNTAACCSLVKFCDALCCRAVAFDWAIGNAFCIIAFTNASLPIEDLLKPLAAKFFSTFSTAPLAHVGILPVSIPSNKVLICVDTKASVGNEATCACTAVGCCIIVAVTCAGLLATAAWISAGSVAVCPLTVAAVPLITCANAPEDNCPWLAWAIAEVVGAAVAPVAVPDKVPVTVPICEPALNVPVCAVPCCAVPVALVIWVAVKAPGAATAVDTPVVGVEIVEPVTVCCPTSVGAAIVVPPNNSSACTAWLVYAWVADGANSGLAIWEVTYLSANSCLVPNSCCCGWEAVGIFSNFLASSPTANFCLGFLFNLTLFTFVIIVYLLTIKIIIYSTYCTC